MVENGKSRFRPREFVEFDGRMGEMVIIFSSDTEQAERREANRKRLEREQGLVMVVSLGATESFLEATSNNRTGGVRKRRSGGGRHIAKRK